MKKIITKHFYKINLFLIVLFYILSLYFDSILLNVVFITFICCIAFLLYYIRKNELDKITQKFLFQQHEIEEKEDRYMSENELDALYIKVYDDHFNC